MFLPLLEGSYEFLLVCPFVTALSEDLLTCFFLKFYLWFFNPNKRKLGRLHFLSKFIFAQKSAQNSVFWLLGESFLLILNYSLLDFAQNGSRLFASLVKFCTWYNPVPRIWVFENYVLNFVQKVPWDLQIDCHILCGLDQACRVCKNKKCSIFW